MATLEAMATLALLPPPRPPLLVVVVVRMVWLWVVALEAVLALVVAVATLHRRLGWGVVTVRAL